MGKMIDRSGAGKPVDFYEPWSSRIRFGPGPQITIPASGFWNTALDHSRIGPETSCTADGNHRRNLALWESARVIQHPSSLVLYRFRDDLTAEELRRLARRERNARVGRRMLAIANALDGMSRAMAAKLAGMDRQTLRDWVIRYNERGVPGLGDRWVQAARQRWTMGNWRW